MILTHDSASSRGRSTSEVRRGVRALLSRPPFYDAFTRLVEGRAVRRELASRYIRARRGDRVLDIGCGTAEIVNFLPDVEYFGFDASRAYIKTARARVSPNHSLWCRAIVGATESLDIPPCDIVLAVGVIHHLGDDEARKLFALASKALAPGGRLITVDGCYVDGQGWLSRFILSHDRGRNIRHVGEYRELAAAAFGGVDVNIRHDLLRMPFTHIIMGCSDIPQPMRTIGGERRGKPVAVAPRGSPVGRSVPVAPPL